MSFADTWATATSQSKDIMIESIDDSDAQRQDMRDLVNEWLDAHPNAQRASFVRSTDFGKPGRKPTLEAAVKRGGFLATIRDATDSAKGFKELAERALFLTTRMQELMLGRAKVLGKELFRSNEAQQLPGDIHGFRITSERFASVTEDLPEDLEHLVEKSLDDFSAERNAALNQALEGIATERLAALEQALLGVKDEHQKPKNRRWRVFERSAWASSKPQRTSFTGSNYLI